ncbi:MAG: tetratricopeptide repeat protein [Pirellulaceae bacterium]|nr:tetratricopeptide repeat protein [Pirellulaceae bacterium]
MTRPIKIFVSSPGDVGEERSIAQRVIERLRFRYAGRAQLEALLWEQLPLLATGSFQEQIPSSGDFDIVVMVLWSRLGTRLPESICRPDGSRYESGTEYEFEQALAAAQARGLPNLLVYRKSARVLIELSANEADLLELTRQKSAVERFIDRWFRSADGSLQAAFHPFESTSQFEDLLERHLRGLIEGKLLDRGELAAERPLWDQGSPFRGLERFDYEHGMIYFGRTAAVNEVLVALRQQAAAGAPFVLIFGKSGVGKSSFARAGVLPLLCDPGVIEGIRCWRRAIFEPSDSTGDLLDGLAAALLSKTALAELAPTTTSETELAALLRQSPAAAIPLLRRALADVSQAANLPFAAGSLPPARLALVIDPLEEIFSRPGANHDDRQRFVAALEALAKSGLVWVLGTMRSDFYERCGELPTLLALKAGSGQYHLAPPTSAEIGRMIRLPAQLAGLRFEEDEAAGSLDERLKDDAASDPGALPLLQFALDEIYKRSDAGRTGLLTFAAYRELGGLYGAIRTRAEETLAEVGRVLEGRLDRAFAAVFSELVGLNQVTEHSVVRLYASLDRISADSDRKSLVEALIAARLFMTDIDDEHRSVVTLAHEALLKHWPRLLHWIEENRDFLRIRGRVQAAATRWQEENREPAFLLAEGKPLAEAEHLLAQRRDQLLPEAIVFIEASARAARAKKQRARRRRRAILAVISGAAVVALVFGIVSCLQYLEANRQRGLAEEQRQLAAARAQAGQELIQFLLKDLRDSLAPDHARDAELIAKISTEVVEHYKKLDSQRDAPQVKLQHADNLLGVAEIFTKMARYQDASDLAQMALDLRADNPSDEGSKLLDTLDLLIFCENQLGHYARAESLLKQAIVASRERLGTGHHATSRVTGRLGELYRQQGRLAEAEKLHREAVRIADASQTALANQRMEPGELAARYNDLAELLRNRGELTEADLWFVKAEHEVEQRVRNQRQLAEIKGNLGVLRFDQGRYDEAAKLLTEALDLDIKAVGADSSSVGADRYKLARVLIAQGKLTEAEEQLKHSEAIVLAKLGEKHLRTAKCWEALAELRLAQKRPTDAAAYALKVLSARELALTAPHPEIIKALELLARIEQARGSQTAADNFAAQAKTMLDRWNNRENSAPEAVASN